VELSLQHFRVPGVAKVNVTNVEGCSTKTRQCQGCGKCRRFKVSHVRYHLSEGVPALVGRFLLSGFNGRDEFS
jgi:hypothetical protein